MAIQTLNTIKNWFKTGLKPSQAQFWDTWDSFRHKFEKVPVKDIDGIDELLLTKADRTILDNHLADKIAHAPQINTDWNSESGFSQLINKPEFKTINGEAIVGDGDITISSAIPTLDQVLNSDNKSLTQPIVFLDEEYSATIDSKNLSIDGPLGERIQYNGDNINWSKGDKNLKLLFDRESTGQNTFSFPEMPDSSTPYKLATDQVVSATQSGIVDTTSLQELGGVDKLINGIRIGRGNNTTNNANTALGSNALTSATTSISNTAIGRSTLALATTGSFNTAVGAVSLANLTTGTQNVTVGGAALRHLTTGSYNLGIGTNALLNTITGSRNTAIGVASGVSVTSDDNIAIGYLAMGNTGVLNTGTYNTVIGVTSGGAITSGSGNTLIESTNTTSGSVTTGSNNIILKQGLTPIGITTGNNNTVIGNVTGLPTDASNLALLSDGSGNIAIRKEADNTLLAPTLTNALIDSGGAKSLVTKEYLEAVILPTSATQSGIVNNTSLQELGGVDKLINGVRVGVGNLLTTSNTVFGSNALGSTTTGGTGNTAIGRNVLSVATTANFNTGVGNGALRYTTTGTQNVAIGGNALNKLTTGQFNLGIGTNALMNNISGVRNTAIGAAAGAGITGNYNTALGCISFGGGSNSDITGTGEFNITIGFQSGSYLTNGSRNVLIEAPATGNRYTTGNDNISINTGTRSNGISTGNGNTIIGGISGLNQDDSNLAIFANGVGDIAIRKEADNRLLAPTLTNALITSGGAKSLITKEYVDDSKQIKDKQIIINGDIDVQENWNGQTIIFKSSGIVRMPMITTEEFSFNAITLEGVNLTWQWANQIEWVFGEPEITPEKKYFNLTKLENTNQIILSV
ncbi:hypothetical protein B0A79_12705 [Flavobacterium piscis]|uniref:Uncharacterized protein n=1 Tax=Flavobacterium piscis TaxID=1114874 RepID=A0ABX2XGJ4_9FLAO|nr:hypothetical protein [Flavobacterium piscis]OCB72084.1 hypothetical protein FLP_16345 [Flavobacterium piscis]OXG04052.1 hypothetical protein B0A79_12705 [Flavobacterium piscis]